MDRRNFLQRLTAGSAGIGAGCAAKGRETAAANFRVKGFTCVTCAVGLEVVLKEQPGVVRVQALYPEGTVAVGFDGRVTTQAKLRRFINETTGFEVTEESPST